MEKGKEKRSITPEQRREEIDLARLRLAAGWAGQGQSNGYQGSSVSAGAAFAATLHRMD